MATNGKAMAMATATLVVQYPNDGVTDADGHVSSFERLIDMTDVLRRIQSATSERTAELVELRCDVEYGPVRGSEADKRRHLERQTRAMASDLGGQDSAVFNVVVTDLTSPDQLDDVIKKLTAKSNDIGVPLALRKQFAIVVTRLRQGSDAGRIRRT